jgi:ubiquinone/menaquinone biosynthesis C-methylase UbiE
MKFADYLKLLEKAGIGKKQVWADLGSGEGTFTMALAELGGTDLELYSVDRDKSRLATQQGLMRAKYRENRVHYLNADFTRPMDLPELDGILMANSLHFVKDKEAVLSDLSYYLKRAGKLVIVEYNVDAGNYWVPYPVSYNSLFFLLQDMNLSSPQLLHIAPSRFLNEMYSALSLRIR